MRILFFIIVYFACITVYSQKTSSLIYRADSALDKGNVSLSLQLYSKAIKQDTNNAYLYIRRGICFKYLNDNKSAITDLTKGILKSNLQENKLVAYKERGRAYRNSGQYSKALIDFTLGGMLNSRNMIETELINECFAKIENQDSCYKTFSSLILANDSLQNKANLYLCRSILRENNFSLNEKNSDLNKMKIEFKKTGGSDSLLEYHYLYNYRIAYNYYELDSFETALKHVNQCLRFFPKYHTALTLKANIYIYKMDFSNAEKHLKSISKLDPEIVYLDFNWGLFYLKQKKYKEAIDSYEKYLLKAKKDAQAYRNIGYCYNKLVQYEKAIKYYKLALQNDSLNAANYNSIAWNLFLLNKHEEGLPFSTKSLALDSSTAIYFDTKACLLFGLNQFEESIKLFSKAINLDPGLVNSFRYRARSYIKMKDNVSACNDIYSVKILTLNPILKQEDSDLKQFHEKNCK